MQHLELLVCDWRSPQVGLHQDREVVRRMPLQIYHRCRTHTACFCCTQRETLQVGFRNPWLEPFLLRQKLREGQLRHPTPPHGQFEETWLPMLRQVLIHKKSQNTKSCLHPMLGECCSCRLRLLV